MSQATSNATLVLPTRLKQALMALSALGVVLVGVGIATHSVRFWHAFLMAFFLLVGLGLSGLFLVAINFATRARWAVAIRRVPEAMGQTLFVSAGLLVLLLFGAHSIYEWSHAAVVDADPILTMKKSWLNIPWFSIRSVIYVAGWLFFGWQLLKHSRQQDKDGDVGHTIIAGKWSIAYLIFFGFSFYLAATDWIMTLDPHWFSTIFGVYCFAGIIQSGFAMMILLVNFLEWAGPLKGVVREEHRLDLARFMFAFSAFWAYMWFSQYMLIWFADLPEETGYYLQRGGIWAILMGLTVLLRFFAPFFGVASQKAKKSRLIASAVAVIVIAAHVLDLHVMIMPYVRDAQGHSSALGLYDALLPACALAFFLLLFFRAFSKHPATPQKDPGMDFSRHYH